MNPFIHGFFLSCMMLTSPAFSLNLSDFDTLAGLYDKGDLPDVSELEANAVWKGEAINVDGVHDSRMLVVASKTSPVLGQRFWAGERLPFSEATLEK